MYGNRHSFLKSYYELFYTFLFGRMSKLLYVGLCKLYNIGFMVNSEIEIYFTVLANFMEQLHAASNAHSVNAVSWLLGSIFVPTKYVHTLTA